MPPKDTRVRRKEGETAAEDGDFVGDWRWKERIRGRGRREMVGEAKMVAESGVDVCGGEKEGGEEERSNEDLDAQGK